MGIYLFETLLENIYQDRGAGGYREENKKERKKVKKKKKTGPIRTHENIYTYAQRGHTYTHVRPSARSIV
jgi:hypothetical protein